MEQNNHENIIKEDPLFIFLHIPHTSGRRIKDMCKTEIRIDNVFIRLHNEEGIKKYKERFPEKNNMKYFVLREPIGRTIGEYVHYTNHIKKHGWVNHLNRNTIIEINEEEINIFDPFQYVTIENNKNLYCKFLLLKEDFSQEITEKDYEEVIRIIEDKECFFDIFGNQLYNLEYILGRSINMNQDKNKKGKYESDIKLKSKYMNDEKLIELIKEENKYDIQFFIFLMNLMEGESKDIEKKIIRNSRHCGGMF